MSKTTLVKRVTKKELEETLRQMRGVIGSLQDVARRCAELHDRALEAGEDLAERFREVKGAERYVPMVRQLVLVGKGLLNAELAMMDPRRPGVKRLREMPRELQDAYVERPVKVLRVGADGKTDHALKGVEVLTAQEAQQVFNGERVRTVEQQRAWLEEQETPRRVRAAVTREGGWQVKGGYLVTTGAVKVSVASLMAELGKRVG